MNYSRWHPSLARVSHSSWILLPVPLIVATTETLTLRPCGSQRDALHIIIMAKDGKNQNEDKNHEKGEDKKKPRKKKSHRNLIRKLSLNKGRYKECIDKSKCYFKCIGGGSLGWSWRGQDGVWGARETVGKQRVSLEKWMITLLLWYSTAKS